MKPRVLVRNGERETDVTEAVATLYDLLRGSMDWGSGFLDIDDVLAILALGEACGFIPPEEARQQGEAYLSGRFPTCPACSAAGRVRRSPTVSAIGPEANGFRPVTLDCGHAYRLVWPPGEHVQIVEVSEP